MVNRNVLVGVFVLVGVIMFAAGLLLVGNRNKAFDKHMELYTQFANVGGLIQGAKVRVAGMEGGQVLGIEVPNSPDGRFRIKMQVESKLRGLIRTDSITSIEKEGIVGDTYLLIHTGSAKAEEASDHSTLPGKEPFDMSVLLEKGNKLVGDADGAINTAKATIQQVGGDLHHTLGGADTTIGNANDVIAGVKQGRGAVGLLLRDGQFRGEVQGAMDNAQQATGSLKDASTRADQMVADLQNRQLTAKVDDTMNSARDAAAHLDATSSKLDQTLAEATAPDRNGVSAGENLRETLSSTTNATGNLADDTEALKHEFFFKSFFKKRGYYNLSDMSPDSYRHDRVFSSAKDRRVWLQASELFEKLPDGSERLSPGGKRQLDEALTQNNGALVGQPFLVEGYSAQGDPTQQMATSRQRSVLASHYLEKHFQLAPADVGSIGLLDTPPDGVEHAHWDGVSIVVLPVRKKK